MQALAAQRFDPRTGRWLAAPPCRSVECARLTLVTYNLWFAEHRLEQRLGALLEEVRRCTPDLVALQEVTGRHLALILDEDWVRRDFQVSDARGDTVRPHGVLLLSRLPLCGLGMVRLTSGKDRKALVADLAVNGQPLRLGAVHLESSETSTGLRLRQLEEVERAMGDVPHALLTGDFNFDPDQGPEQARVEARYTDLWSALRPGEPGYTEDTDVNRMRLLHKSREKRVRFDRVLTRSASPGWRPLAIRRLGTQPVTAGEPALFPSDHFGLCAALTWEEG